ncbi:hypothetical protein F4818DRAFT_446006 [Hypoxylon cercidicola]|nr:hypothetical protein F4818DRAFT_446006 [Hypoxylon cercidicola]
MSAHQNNQVGNQHRNGLAPNMMVPAHISPNGQVMIVRVPMHEAAGRVCANCNRMGHTLSQCVTNWSPAGDIPGCYRCNTLSHIIDTCHLPPYSDRMRFEIEVLQRRGLPPLRSTRGWNQLAVLFHLHTGGPISRRGVLRLDRRHFDSWNYNLSVAEQGHLLVLDPDTANMGAISVVADQGYRPHTAQQ